MRTRTSRLGAWFLVGPVVGLVCLGAAGPWEMASAAEEFAVLQRARQLARTDRNWKDRRQKFALRVIDRSGRERLRELVMLTERERPGHEKTLAVFLSPADVRATAFLQHVAGTNDTTQWLFLPELGRSRRIHGGARTQSFVGTDFSYADLDLIENVLHWGETDASVKRIPASESGLLPGRVAYEFRPHEGKARYARIILELSEQDSLVRSMRMFEQEEGPPAKVLQFGEIREVGSVPTAFRLEMARPERGSRTVVEVSGVRYDAGFEGDAFSKRALENGLDHVE